MTCRVGTPDIFIKVTLEHLQQNVEGGSLTRVFLELWSFSLWKRPQEPDVSVTCRLGLAFVYILNLLSEYILPSYFPAAGGNCDSFRLTSSTLKNIFLVVGLVSESFYFLCGIPLARKEEEMSRSYVAVSAAMASASVGQRSIKFSFEEDVQAMPGHVWLVVFKNSTLAEEATNGFILKEQRVRPKLVAERFVRATVEYIPPDASMREIEEALERFADVVSLKEPTCLLTLPKN